jgi:hypothetical protein
MDSEDGHQHFESTITMARAPPHQSRNHCECNTLQQREPLVAVVPTKEGSHSMLEPDQWNSVLSRVTGTIYRNTERISSNALLNLLQVGPDTVTRQKVGKRARICFPSVRSGCLPSCSIAHRAGKQTRPTLTNLRCWQDVRRTVGG